MGNDDTRRVTYYQTIYLKGGFMVEVGAQEPEHLDKLIPMIKAAPEMEAERNALSVKLTTMEKDLRAYIREVTPLRETVRVLREALGGMLNWARRIHVRNPGTEVADAAAVYAHTAPPNIHPPPVIEDPSSRGWFVEPTESPDWYNVWWKDGTGKQCASRVQRELVDVLTRHSQRATPLDAEVATLREAIRDAAEGMQWISARLSDPSGDDVAVSSRQLKDRAEKLRAVLLAGQIAAEPPTDLALKALKDMAHSHGIALPHKLSPTEAYTILRLVSKLRGRINYDQTGTARADRSRDQRRE